MKKIVMFLLAVFFSSSLFAAPFDKLIFFGDSLSDNGNLYKYLFKILPKSPPYYQGRFSNGPIWSETVGKYYYDKYYIDYKVYALGGATAIFHLPTTRFISPTNLEIEINKYLADNLFNDKSQSLFSIWIGSNDYLYYQENDADELTTKIVTKISWAINTLIEHGGKNFLVLNVPDLSKTPFARANGSISILHNLSELHNHKLAAAMDDIKILYPDVKIVLVDIYALLNDVMADPAKYNKKYNINITNTNDSCWGGGYTLKTALAKDELSNKLHQTLLSQQGNDFNANVVSDLILNSPSLHHSYAIGHLYDLGFVPCPNASEYLFWDQLHPTTIVHQILSQIVIGRLESQLAA